MSGSSRGNNEKAKQTTTQTSLNSYISRVSSEFNLPSNELSAILSEACQEQTSNNPKGKEKGKKVTTLNKQCRYNISRGVNKGSRCKNNVSVDSLTGEFCKLHLKQESSFSVLFKEENKKVIAKLNSCRPCLSLEKNEYGNFEHIPTHFVFDRTSKKVIGKQQRDKILVLTKDDISLCKEYFFDYVIPETLREEDENNGEEKVDEKGEKDEKEEEREEDELDFDDSEFEEDDD